MVDSFFNLKNQWLFLYLVFVSALSLYALFVFGDDFSRFVKYTKIPENLRIKFNELIRIDSRTSYNVSKELYVTINERGAGYGNRMYTILSGLTIALLTQRKPYIDFPQIEGYIREPEPHLKYINNSYLISIIDVLLVYFIGLLIVFFQVIMRRLLSKKLCIRF